MSVERLFLLDPYNDKHLEMIKSFEKDNNIDTKISETISKLRSSINKEDYQKNTKEQNEISQYLFIEKNMKITDLCNIQGEKDIKTCRITLADIKSKKRKIVSLASNYAIERLGMEEVFINIPTDNKSMLTYLDTLDFENLGEENGHIMFLKERYELEQSQRKIS